MDRLELFSLLWFSLLSFELELELEPKLELELERGFLAFSSKEVPRASWQARVP